VSRVSSFGVLVEYGCEKKITQFSNLSASVAVGVPSGVTLKLRLLQIMFILCLSCLNTSVVFPCIFYRVTLCHYVLYSAFVSMLALC